MSELRITSVDWRPIRMKRQEPFTIATGSSESVVNILIAISTPDFTGYGFAVPNMVTGEDEVSITEFIRSIVPDITGRDALDIDGLHSILWQYSKYPAARAGLTAALYDILGKAEGVPVYSLLGGKEGAVETFVTIGIMDLDSTLKKAREWVSRGFRRLKIKVGLDLKSDLKRVEAMRDEFRNIMICVDCNQGYELEEASEFLREVESLDIEFVEQPVRAGEKQALLTLMRDSEVPVMLDESVWGLEDLLSFVFTETVKLINIKLAKCGGIPHALRMCEVCSVNGVKCMVGCMSECQGSIAPSLHLALVRKEIVYADLDSPLSIMNDPTVAIRYSDGKVSPVSRPGFGIAFCECGQP